MLFVTYGGGHVNAIFPVIKELQQTTEWEITTLGLTTAGNVLKKEGIPYIGFKDLIEPTVDNYALEIGSLLANESDNSKVPYEESVAYLGLSYVDLEKRHGKQEASKLYKEQGRQAFLPLSILERLIKKVNPNVIVTTNSPRAEQATVMTAKKFSIPCVCLVDLFAVDEFPRLAQKGYGNRICVITNRVKEKLISAGRTEEEIVVTGNPAFDKLADETIPQKARIFRNEKKWDNKKTILWASQPNVEQPQLPRMIEAELLELLNGHEDWHIVFRPHPSEQIVYNHLPERVTISDTNDELPVLIKAVDMVLTMTSTVGLESVLIGKPLVTVDIGSYIASVPYSEMGLSYGVSHLHDLEKGILLALSGENNLYRKAVLPELGKAAERVSNVIKQLSAGE
ncbi:MULTISPECIES: UDP-N-acetylglucosamine 2-epimerase [unclassified Brevibacillus]|uniref:UDP-N-acetylglucosamine 2-epimerase n=1 Tax=unclassified Brevibacillus TaxID=2684853 RepID=UPI0035663CDC